MPQADTVVITTSERWCDPYIVPKLVSYALPPEDVTKSSMTSDVTSNTTSVTTSKKTTTGSSVTPSTPVFLVISSLIIGDILLRKKKI